MPLDTIFGAINLMAIAGWIALLAGPLMPVLSQRIAAFLCPTLLALTYVALIAAALSGLDGVAPGGEGPSPGFTTLDSVAAIFATREAVLTGWAHYLAFDLLVGAWEAREARRLGIPHWLVVPCLVLTFVAGPAGFLVFLALRWPYRRSSLRQVPAR